MPKDPKALDTLPERNCESPMKHDEHLLTVHQPGTADDEHFRCPGRAEDE